MAENPVKTPLPADLPTDWAYGQTVAPSGAEAGLSQQHGYNYLMQQVNAAQQAAKEIGQAFSGLPSLGADGKIPSDQLPEMDYDPAGSAAAVKKALNSHTGNRQNPHGVTAEQAGADPAGTAASAISTHNQDEEAHPALQAKLNAASMAVKATYPIAEGQTITAGDVVDVVEGKITRTQTPQANVDRKSVV